MNAIIVFIALSASDPQIEPASQPASASAPAAEAIPAKIVKRQPPFIRGAAPREPREAADVQPFMRDVRIDVGYKATFITNKSYAALGAGMALSQSALGVSWAAFSWGRFALAPGLRWEASLAAGDMRGVTLRQATHRAMLSLDARYRPLRWLDVFARGAGGAFINELSLGGGASPVSSASRTAAFTGDLSLGVDLLLGPHKQLARRGVRVWFTLEGGYSYTAPMIIALAPQLGADDPRRTGTTSLGALNMHGPFARLALTLAF